jgi:hypothetical protein
LKGIGSAGWGGQDYLKNWFEAKFSYGSGILWFQKHVFVVVLVIDPDPFEVECELQRVKLCDMRYYCNVSRNQLC